jgi:hypothetical protein
MPHWRPPVAGAHSEASLSVMGRDDDKQVPAEVLARPGRMATEVAGRELERAGDELRSDAQVTLRASVAAGAAVTAGLLGLHLVTLALVDALSRRRPRWAAFSLVGTGLLGAGALAGRYGWRHRPEAPLAQTRASFRYLLRLVLDHLD